MGGIVALYCRDRRQFKYHCSCVSVCVVIISTRCKPNQFLVSSLISIKYFTFEEIKYFFWAGRPVSKLACYSYLFIICYKTSYKICIWSTHTICQQFFRSKWINASSWVKASWHVLCSSQRWKQDHKNFCAFNILKCNQTFMLYVPFMLHEISWLHLLLEP